MMWQRDANSIQHSWVSSLVLLAGMFLLGTPTAAAAPTIFASTITPAPITPGDFLSATFVGGGFGQTPGIFEYCDDAALTQCFQFTDSLPGNWDLTWSDTRVRLRVYPIYTSQYTPGTKTYYVRIYDGGKAVSNVVPVPVTVAQAAPPTLTALTPDSGPTGGWLQFTIRGTGFTASTRIKAWDGLDRLRAEWYEGMPGPELFRFVDATRIDVGCETYAPYGDYQVAASHAAGTSNRLTFHLLPGTSLHLRSIPFTERYTDSAGGVHPIELYELTNRRTGTISHLLLALPASDSAATSPYPTIVFTNPYGLFPSPPSQDDSDVLWSGMVPPQTCGFYPDVSFPPPSIDFEQLTCSTTPCRIVICSLPLAELGASEVATSLMDWALRNGYAAAAPFGRFYAARDLLSAPYEITGAIEALKTLSSVDGSRIGITGGSLGGYETIYPISRGDMPLTVAAAVAIFPPVDFRKMYEYYFNVLPAVQPESLLRIGQDFAIPYFNRLFQAVGATPTHPAWNPLVNDYVADHIDQSPLLLIAGTDDMMVPSSESANLYTALQSRKKRVNSWIYQNGEPPFATKSALEGGHGVMDQRSSVKRRVLEQIFFLNYMPPDVSRVTLRDPDDVEILAMLRELRQTVCDVPKEQPNISDILRYAASPKLQYVITDSALASGDGPTVMAEAINQVWSLEGIHWTAQNVRANLEAGLLPARCGAPSHDAVFVAQSAPKKLVAGQSARVSVTMKNMGTIAWTNGTDHQLGSQHPQDNLTWRLARVALGPSESIAPGQQKTFRFTVTAPAIADAYPFQWRMVQERVEWFGDFSPNVVVQVSADSTPPRVTLTKPASGATVSGNVRVQARALDDVGVGRVDFFVDGSLQGSDSAAPYTYAWDATRWAEGHHTLKVIAIDTADNSASRAVGVTISHPSTVTLTVSPASLRVGERLTVRWRVPAGQASATDWLGLYKRGAPDGSYLVSQPTRGALTGTATFTAPRSTGIYEVRYLGQKSRPSVSKSAAIRVRRVPKSGRAMILQAVP